MTLLTHIDPTTGALSTLVDCACGCGGKVSDASAIRDHEDWEARPYLSWEHMRAAAERWWSAS